MAYCAVSFRVLAAIAVLYIIVLPLAHAQSPASAPSPTSDGNSSYLLFFKITSDSFLNIN